MPVEHGTESLAGIQGLSGAFWSSNYIHYWPVNHSALIIPLLVLFPIRVASRPSNILALMGGDNCEHL